MAAKIQLDRTDRTSTVLLFILAKEIVEQRPFYLERR